MKMFARLVLLALFTAGFARAADGPCASDAARLCAGRGGYLVRKCLLSSLEALSPACRRTMQEVAWVEDHQAQFDGACGKNVAAFCSGMPRDALIRVLPCLRSKAPELAPGCQAILATASGAGGDGTAAVSAVPPADASSGAATPTKR